MEKIDTKVKTKHLYWHEHSIKMEDRWQGNGHKSCVLWFTGLSASGKSTIANALCNKLHEMAIKSYVLLETDKLSVEEAVNKILEYLIENKYIGFSKE